MVDMTQVMADYHERQAERALQAQTETEHLKQAVIGPLCAAGQVQLRHQPVQRADPAAAWSRRLTGRITAKTRPNPEGA